MDRLEAMSLLLKVIDTGSMSAVSRETEIPLPTISRKIGELEKHLGIQILTRTTRRFALTDAGAEYVASARRILEEIEMMERTAGGEYQVPKGELAISAPTFFGRLHLLPLINRFLSDWPEINVKLHLSNRYSDLVEEHNDLALRIGDLPDSSLVAIALGTMRTVTCVHPDVLSRYGRVVSPSDLVKLPLIHIGTPMPSDMTWNDLFAGERHMPLRPRLTVTTPEAALDAAAGGTGVIRVLHYQAADKIRKGELTLILENFEPKPVPVNLIYPRRGPIPLKIRKFIDFSVPALRQTLDSISEGGYQ
jgi:Transcriptional regulator